MHPQPGRLVGEQPEGRAVGLREAEAREPHDHLVDALRHVRGDPVGALRTLDEAPVVGLDRRLRALAAHRPPQPLGLPGEKPANAIATSSTWSWKMIVPSVSCRTGSSEGCS